MSRKNKIIISVTGIILVLVTLIGLTYAYYLTRINGNTNDKSVTVSLANLELTYSDGNGLIEATNIVPGEVIATKTFSVENTGDKKVINYTVYLDDVINTFTNKNDVKLTLTCTSSKGNKCTGTEITYPSTDTLLSINDIEVEEKHNYELKVEFIETNTDQSIDMNKELSGNIIIRDLKGTGSEITNTKGTNSVSVDNAKLLSNYRIYGNSVQDTSTQSKNLCPNFSDSRWTFTNGAYVDTDGNLTLPNLDSVASVKIPWNKKNTYLYLRYYLVSGGNYHINTEYYDYDGKKMTGNGNASRDKTNATEYNVSFGGNNDYGVAIGNSAYIIVKFIRSTNYTPNEYKIKNIAINSDNSVYEEFTPDMPSPEYPSEIKSVGDLITDTSDSNNGKYKIGVKTTGKNLFNVSKVISTSEVINNNNGTLSVTTPSTSSAAKTNGKLSDYCPNLQVGKTYILSANSTGLGKKIYLGTSKFTWKYNTTRTITQQDLDSPVYFYANDKSGDTSIITISNIQIEEGNVATDYESYHEETTNIYLNEPLRQIGNYTDYIDFKSGKVIRNTNSNILSGNEGYANQNGEYDTDNKILFSITLSTNDTNNLMSNRKMLCNYFLPSDKSVQSNLDITGVNFHSLEKYSRTMYFKLPKTILETLDSAGMSKWVKGLYDSGNPLIINYQINQKEESVSLPNIDLSKTKYINIESDTNPSSIELDYIK